MWKIVVLGGGYAGLLAAQRVAHRAAGGAEVTLVDGRETFCERIRLHQVAAGGAVPAVPFVKLLAGTGVRFERGRVASLDAAGQVVRLEDGRALPYDRLVLALGSSVAVTVPGVAEHAHRLDDEASAEALAAAVTELARRQGSASRRVLVCGGGLTGVEAAAELAEAHPSLDVQLLSAGEVGDDLSEKGRAYLRATLARLGVSLLDRAAVARVHPANVELTDGTQRSFELCLWAGGFCAPPLARAAGLAVNERGQMLVDEQLRCLSAPTIYGAGDAAVPVSDVGSSIVMSCRTAMPMAAHVADNLGRALAGKPERPFRLGDSIRCISLGRRAGLVQLYRRDGTLKNRILRGRLGACVKEVICRFTLWSLYLSRLWGGSFRWLQGAPRALPAPAQQQLGA